MKEVRRISNLPQKTPGSVKCRVIVTQSRLQKIHGGRGHQNAHNARHTNSPPPSIDSELTDTATVIHSSVCEKWISIKYFVRLGNFA